MWNVAGIRNKDGDFWKRKVGCDGFVGTVAGGEELGGNTE